MLRWICDNTRRDRVWMYDICKRLEVTPIEEKFVQHHLRWFGHIQWRPVEAPVHSGIIRRTSNETRGRGRTNLTLEESVKRDLKDCCITKELALDRSKDGNGYPLSVCPWVKNLLGTDSGMSLYPWVRVWVAFDIHGYLQNR
jgi:hypothetical protein